MDDGASAAPGSFPGSSATGSVTLLTRRRFLAVIVSIALAAGGYLGIALWSGWEAVSAAIARVGWLGTGVVVALAFLSYLVRTLRWTMFLKALGHSIPARDNVRIYLAGFALTTTPGKVGETMRSVLLRPYGVPYASSLSAFFADRFCDLIGILLVTGALAQLLYPAARIAGLVLLVLLAAMLVVYLHEHRVLELIERLVQRLSRRTHFAVSARTLAANALTCLRPRRFVAGVTVSCIAWGLQGLSLAYVLSRIGHELPVALAVFVFFFSTLVGAASMIPSGLGTHEAAMIGLLSAYGVDTPSAIAATLILRIGTLWFAVAMGLGFTIIASAHPRPG